jgi:GNAT superfamily N-acetyltransferase
MEIRIRDAAAEDLPAVLALLKQLDVGHDKPFSPAAAQHVFERLQSYPGHHLYVAVAQTRIVGTFVLMVIDSVAHGGMPHGLVEDVVVDPEWQGRGIGKRMMQFAMDQCRDAGCYKMALSSHLSRDKTHRFYESLGFEKHGFSYLIR